MNRALWIVQKNQICATIKKISDHFGGDDIEWLREYCRDLIELNKNDLKPLLDGCADIERALKFMERKRST